MPLYEKFRIEIYIPAVPRKVYMVLLAELAEELTTALGGCTIIPRLDGFYLSDSGKHIYDLINIIFTDSSDLSLDDEECVQELNRYVDYVVDSINKELKEEAIMIAVYNVRNTLKPFRPRRPRNKK